MYVALRPKLMRPSSRVEAQTKFRTRRDVGACARTAVGLVVVLLLATQAHAVDKCKAKIDTKTGAIQVSASNVAGALRWGGSIGNEVNPFSNDATCVASGKAKKCELGAPGSEAQITPPELCRLFLSDGTGNDCSFFVKGCVVMGDPCKEGRSLCQLGGSIVVDQRRGSSARSSRKRRTSAATVSRSRSTVMTWKLCSSSTSRLSCEPRRAYSSRAADTGQV